MAGFAMVVIVTSFAGFIVFRFWWIFVVIIRRGILLLLFTILLFTEVSSGLKLIISIWVARLLKAPSSIASSSWGWIIVLSKGLVRLIRLRTEPASVCCLSSILFSGGGLLPRLVVLIFGWLTSLSLSLKRSIVVAAGGKRTLSLLWLLVSTVLKLIGSRKLGLTRLAIVFCCYGSGRITITRPAGKRLVRTLLPWRAIARITSPVSRVAGIAGMAISAMLSQVSSYFLLRLYFFEKGIYGSGFGWYRKVTAKFGF